MAESSRRPNVLFVLTDDQAYGDVGRHGNEIIRTPNMDRLYDESVRFTQFYVSPVCSPTRASLMTGRWHMRTGVIDTYLGRSTLRTNERVLPEVLADAGYRTGIFGKWHLGDHYPTRPVDRGFHESLTHNGGGLGQPADPPENESSYTDPLLHHNGVIEKHEGYCTDIWTDAAIAFVEENRERPWFAYVSHNAPHSPLNIADEYWRPYAAQGLDEAVARTYGMIQNIDENLGRMLDRIDALGLRDNTLVIFMTDNGPCASQGPLRFNAGCRDRKGTAYEGGIRVPSFWRWPAGFEGGRDASPPAAHVDLLPTLCEICGAKQPADRVIDGVSLVSLLKNTGELLPDRNLFLQWHRGDEPEAYNNCAVRGPRYKLVNGRELYDLEADPGEQDDLAAEQPERVQEMRSAYEAWFADVTKDGFAPVRILAGTPYQNPVMLTKQDWHGIESWRDRDGAGYWEIDLAAEDRYDLRLLFSGEFPARRICVRWEGIELWKKLDAGQTECRFERIDLPAGEGKFEAWLETDDGVKGVRYVFVERVGTPKTA